MNRRITATSLLLTLIMTGFAAAAHHKHQDNTLTQKQREQGWQLLFNGHNADGWKCNNGESVSPAVVDDHALQVTNAGCSYIYYAKQQFDDFVLSLDVRQAKEDANSGIFIRVKNPARALATGFEVQVFTGGTGRHSLGAIYDLVPAKVDAQKPAGKWNHVEIRCKGPHIQVKVNGKVTARMDTSKWTEEGQRLDGSEHKFGGVIADRPQSGHIMLQEHGAKVWYKNIKVRELKDKQ
jgi:hypothetical protein